MQKINLVEKPALFSERWRPKIIAEEEVSLLLFEPASPLNTGCAGSEHPGAQPDRI